MIIPAFLQKGDTVAIVSPAGFIAGSYINKAVEILEQWGLKVIEGASVCKQYSVFAGTDDERAADFQTALDDDDVKAVICSRGGYGSIRIIEKLDFSKFKKKPKWITGFSDITIFHSYFNNSRIASLHSAMPKNYPSATEAALDSLKFTLFGDRVKYSIPPHKANRHGNVTGELIGGNLSIIYSLLGTKFNYNFQGKILFIEDLSERLYHIDRMMKSLKYAGVFNKIAGLIIGGMTDMYDGASPYGMNAYEIIEENIREYNFPVCFNAPFGHFDNNTAVIIGTNYSLNVEENKIELQAI